MPYKSRETARDKSKERMQRMRERNKGVTNTPQDVTPNTFEGFLVSTLIDETIGKPYAILQDSSKIRIDKLINPIFRQKIYSILEYLRTQDRDNLRCGVTGPTFKDVEQLLETTEYE